MLNNNIKNTIMADIENAVYTLFMDGLNEYGDGTELTRAELCDFISNYLIERAIEEKKYLKNL